MKERSEFIPVHNPYLTKENISVLSTQKNVDYDNQKNDIKKDSQPLNYSLYEVDLHLIRNNSLYTVNQQYNYERNNQNIDFCQEQNQINLEPEEFRSTELNSRVNTFALRNPQNYQVQKKNFYAEKEVINNNEFQNIERINPINIFHKYQQYFKKLNYYQHQIQNYLSQIKENQLFLWPWNIQLLNIRQNSYKNFQGLFILLQRLPFSQTQQVDRRQAYQLKIIEPSQNKSQKIQFRLKNIELYTNINNLSLLKIIMRDQYILWIQFKYLNDINQMMNFLNLSVSFHRGQ